MSSQKVKIKLVKSATQKVAVHNMGGSSHLATVHKALSQHSRIFTSILTGLIVGGLFSFGVYAFANPPSSPFSLPAPLNPGCGPTDANCTTEAPITGGPSATFKYDNSNYANLNVASNGDLTVSTTSNSGGGNITLDGSGSNGTILSNSGILVLGGGLSGDESLNLDFHDNTDTVGVSSTTGVTTLDLGSLNIQTTGTLTLGGSTDGTLVTRVKAGAPTESDTNGSLVVDSNSGRIYFRYGGAWHYVAQTAGFQIPDFETNDPISGDPIKKGDLVIGMINQQFEDNALHGIWVKWDSVKEELIQELQASGGISSTALQGDSATASTSTSTGIIPFIDKVKNALTSFGITIANEAVTVKNLVAEKFQAKTARIERLELVDSATGDVYCTFIENGDWKKVKGECDSVEAKVNNSVADQQINHGAQQAAQEAAQQAAEQVQNQLQEQVQAEVQQQLAQQATPSPTAEISPSPTETPAETPAPSEEPADNSAPAPTESVSVAQENSVPEDHTPSLPEQAATQATEAIQNATSALYERMGQFLNWTMRGMNSSFKKSSAGVMAPLKDIWQNGKPALVAPFQSLWTLNPAGLVSQMSSDFSQTVKKVVVGGKAEQKVKTTASVVGVAKEVAVQSAKSLSVLNPKNLVSAMSASFSETLHKIAVGGKLDNKVKATVLMVPTSQPAESLALLNPLPLVKEASSEFSKNVGTVSKLATQKKVLPKVEVGKLPVNFFMGVQHGEAAVIKGAQRLGSSTQGGLVGVAAFNKSLSVSIVKNVKMGAASLNQLWVFNPLTVTRLGISDLSGRLQVVKKYGSVIPFASVADGIKSVWPH